MFIYWEFRHRGLVSISIFRMAKQDPKKTTAKKTPAKKAAAKKAVSPKTTAKKAAAKKTAAKKVAAPKKAAPKKESITLDQVAQDLGLDLQAIETEATVKAQQLAEKDFDVVLQKLEEFAVAEKPKLIKRFFSWLKK